MCSFYINTQYEGEMVGERHSPSKYLVYSYRQANLYSYKGVAPIDDIQIADRLFFIDFQFLCIDRTHIS